MDKTVTVSIGRNIGNKPMPDAQWEEFFNRVAMVVQFSRPISEIHFAGSGTGHYEGETEESFTIVATVSDDAIKGIRHELSRLAAVYQQECIALTIGDSELIGAEPNMKRLLAFEADYAAAEEAFQGSMKMPHHF